MQTVKERLGATAAKGPGSVRWCVVLGAVAGLAVPHLVVPAASAATWHVSPDGSGDVATIQDAVNAAAAGDSILLAPGTYLGDGNRDVVIPRDLVVASTGGAAATVIDVEGSDDDPHRAFHIVAGAGPGCVIRGITIQNGKRTDDAGAGVLCELSSPRFVECVFRDNRAGFMEGSRGGAVAAIGASPSFEDCEFRANCGGLAGGGIHVEGGTVRVDRCVFAANTACFGSGGAASGREAALHFDRCAFEENHASNHGGNGGAIEVYSCLLEVTNSSFLGNFALAPDAGTGGAIMSEGGEVNLAGNVFALNSAAVQGGALSIYHGSATITSCTLAGNGSPHGGAIRVGRLTLTLERSILASSTEGAALVCDDAGEVFASCNDVHGNAGGDWVGCLAGLEGVDGNFALDPRFCDPEAATFTLEDGSPCLPGEHPGGEDCGLIGALDRGCAGPVRTEAARWGAVKSLFRAVR